MTDIKTEIKSFATAEKQKVQAWFNSNWVTLLAGAIVGGLIVELLHKL